ncbi:MAG: aromatic hydrocarbon degradation protein, partial [Smithella sp.]
MKKIIRVSLMSIVAAVLMTSSVYATNGMRMIGFGPVQDSMGGVSVGLPLDAASVLTNPAGMSVLPGRIDFGASYFVPS